MLTRTHLSLYKNTIVNVSRVLTLNEFFHSTDLPPAVIKYQHICIQEVDGLRERERERERERDRERKRERDRERERERKREKEREKERERERKRE